MIDYLIIGYEGVVEAGNEWLYSQGSTVRLHVGDLVDYIPDHGIAEGVRLHGYRLVEIEPSGWGVKIVKEGHGPLDSVPFRVQAHLIRPTTECPWATAERRCQMAADRCKARRAVRRRGLTPRMNAPIRFTQHGAYVPVEDTVFVSFN